MINKLSKTSLLMFYTTYEIKLIYYMTKILQNLLISIYTGISASFKYCELHIPFCNKVYLLCFL